jgi:PKD repeat protein
MRRIALLTNFAKRACVAALVLCATSALALEQSTGVEPDAEHEALVANPYASSGNCGVERWSVKTGTDADAGLVNLSSPQTNDIVTLRSWPAPSTIPLNNRVSPYETTMWVLNATLVEYKLENDSDYHLVIKDDSGNTMIAEIPDPACVGSGSPFGADIQSARAQFDAKYSATTSFHTANIPVQLTGVAMFDFLHGQTGVAPNGIELHPTLGIVFNPSGGGSPDFALSAAPQSVSVEQGAGASTTIAVTPSNGFASAVSFSATGLPSGVTASFSPASSAASTTLSLSAASTAAAGSAVATVTGTSGSISHSTTVNLTVITSGGGGGSTAVYNSTLKAPECTAAGASCDSGTLLVGRGTMSGGVEPNQPNTINASCADGNSGTFHSDESNDRIVISSTDGGPLTAGKTAQVTATMWAYGTANAIDFYSAADASNPSWTFLSSISASAAGTQLLSTTFTLPAGGLQAVRAHLRYNGSASPCSTGSYDESDDLIFAVSSTAPAPDFSMSASPATLSLAQGANGTSSVTISPQNGFSGSVALSASGLPSGVTASFSPASTTGSSTLTLSASSTAATGNATVTVTGTSGSLTHTATLGLTVNAAVTGGTPSANFAFTTSGLAASFTDSSTDAGGTIGSHAWTFGDGGTSTATNPSHTYAAAGTFSVTETVTDSVNGTSSSKTQSVTVSSGGGGGNVLQNGVAVTGLSAATGGQLTYTMVVPAGATGLSFQISGGSGDADLYVKFGSAPTLSSYDCRPYVTGNSETCNISNVQAGTYYVMLNAYAAFSGVSLVGSYTAGGGGGGGGCTPSGTVLCSGSIVTGLAATKGNWSSTYSIVIPSGSSSLTVAISGSSGDADLYVRNGSAPTTSSYTCRPYLTGDNETCTISSPTAGATYYIRVRAYATYSGVTLTTTIQ